MVEPEEEKVRKLFVNYLNGENFDLLKYYCENLPKEKIFYENVRIHYFKNKILKGFEYEDIFPEYNLNFPEFEVFQTDWNRMKQLHQFI
jgi:hypothetical protein